MNKETITTIILIALIITIAIAIMIDIIPTIESSQSSIGMEYNITLGEDLPAITTNPMWYLLEVIALILVISGGFYFNIKLYQQKE